MDTPEKKRSYLEISKIAPDQLLEGEAPRLVDEWQLAPNLWDAVRHSIDRKNKEGLYIFTGSSSVNENEIEHSGAGRFARLRMNTLSLFESEDSNGEVSLLDMFDGVGKVASRSELSVKDISELIIKGGWPQIIDKSVRVARIYVAEYCKSIVSKGISSIDGKSRDSEKTLLILKSLARNVGTSVSDSKIKADIEAHQSIHRNTLSDYLTALNKLFVTSNVPAWNPKLRSKRSIRTSPTRYLADPSISASLLGATPEKLFQDIETFGFLFESLVMRDLRVYMTSLDGMLYHYRDKTGLEADAVVQLSDGRWGLIEIKLGGNEIDKAASNLKKIVELVDSNSLGKPSFLAIVTGTEYAYTREDGVHVIPVGCLKN